MLSYSSDFPVKDRWLQIVPAEVAGLLNRLNMRNGFRCSDLELRNPRNAINIGPGDLEGCALRRFAR
eukprot:15159837-Alexandrium_andersonii.AAC.1